MIVVWFSCGVASAVALQETLRQYGQHHEVRAVNNPVAEEDQDNRRFLHDIERWLGIEIEVVGSTRYPDNSAVSVWAHRRFMNSPHGAVCTLELKKRVRQEWEDANKPDWHVLGFTADEQKRHERFVLTERNNVIPVLIDARLSKADCYMRIAEAGIEPPRVYKHGYPNANCIGCVKATSPTYWNLVREVHPDVFASRAAQSRELGVRLVRYKGERIFLDELPEGARGQSLKTMDIECGIFCEEPTHE